MKIAFIVSFYNGKLGNGYSRSKEKLLISFGCSPRGGFAGNIFLIQDEMVLSSQLTKPKTELRSNKKIRTKQSGLSFLLRRQDSNLRSPVANRSSTFRNNSFEKENPNK
jgi:hypothetical protein